MFFYLTIKLSLVLTKYISSCFQSFSQKNPKQQLINRKGLVDGKHS